jgi:hypothetical protein
MYVCVSFFCGRNTEKKNTAKKLLRHFFPFLKTMVMDFSCTIDIEIENRRDGMPSSRDLSYETATIMANICVEEERRRWAQDMQERDRLGILWRNFKPDTTLAHFWREDKEKAYWRLRSPQMGLRTVIESGKKLSEQHTGLTLVFEFGRSDANREQRHWFYNGEHISQQELQVSYSWGPRCAGTSK